MKVLWENIKKSTGTIVMIAVLLIAYNTATNGHYHITESGFILWHAHPHSDNSGHVPIKSHSHTDFELLFLQMLTNLLLAIIVFFGILFSNTIKIAKLFSHYISPVFDNFLLSFKSLRAPPVLS